MSTQVTGLLSAYEQGLTAFDDVQVWNNCEYTDILTYVTEMWILYSPSIIGRLKSEHVDNLDDSSIGGFSDGLTLFARDCGLLTLDDILPVEPIEPYTVGEVCWYFQFRDPGLTPEEATEACRLLEEEG